MTNPDLGRDALVWARRGWRVFPCLPSKRPATPNGFHDASSDPEAIAAWNWQMIGGVPASAELVVLDIDSQAGASLSDIPADGLETRRHRTRSGGYHLVYKARPGATYGNGPRPDLGAGIDVRHADGYVILPPSPGYSFDESSSREPAVAPEWLERPASAALEASDAPAGSGIPIPPGSQDHELRRVASRAYAAGLDELAVRAAIRSTIETRCVEQDPRRPWTEADVCRLARPDSLDSIEAAINSGRLDTFGDRSPPEERKLKLYRTADLAALKPPEFLLEDESRDGFLIAGGFNVLVGPSGGGKTLLAIDFASRLAVAGKRVVYVLAEGQAGAYRRTRGWAEHYGEQLPDLAWIVQSFAIHSDADELLELIGETDLVVFDTLARVSAGMDEDRAQEMGRLIQLVDYVRERAQTATLLVHHSGWDDSRERGSTALRGASDVMLHLRPTKDDRHVLELRCAKMKEAEQWEAKYRRIIGVQIPDADPFGRPPGVIVPADAPLATPKLGLDAAGADVEALAREFGERLFARAEAEPLLGVAKTAAARRLSRLVELGYLHVEGDGIDTRYLFTEKGLRFAR